MRERRDAELELETELERHLATSGRSGLVPPETPPGVETERRSVAGVASGPPGASGTGVPSRRRRLGSSLHWVLAHPEILAAAAFTLVAAGVGAYFALRE
jgi:hypothetical protein